MSSGDSQARLVHAVPGRLRVRLHKRVPASLLDGLAAVRAAPGVQAVEVRAAARSVVVRYHPAEASEIEVLEAFAVAGLIVEYQDGGGERANGSLGRISPSAPGRTSPASSLAHEPFAGGGQAGPSASTNDGASRLPRTTEPLGCAASPCRRLSVSADRRVGAERGSGSTLRELLIGPPPKLDRRFAESLALSAVSFVGARQVGLALGGGMTLPAYFVIWLVLRRLTGAGRRR
jgi:hypothetical protein